ncbi:hypothetical protein AB0B04_19165 [Streptomyces xinghaiensis]|uniref:Uncharacterized protein n=2 Tax=Streptomyces TaxID=1883 RepID=A0A3R7IZL6_9ACTN|nr:MULTISPECIES: hypothetical protein [Streptomyces]KNE83315.1 hypothetical protein ADZ36_05650 [Streptomyces fradiae]OFA44206.1 hypothetical protein BEN35_22640 [Streptomyces fradiae]PQM20603.1 hypothetical protein Sfr7A_25775 [Streptomyces xinghaiensis]RKM92545.1 hypothetical protein SFRA_024430 [Streptomyces xinghaiensis]RNC70512.1 hypothetical protein DC095_025420 [Streptomyces xinghaiensis]
MTTARTRAERPLPASAPAAPPAAAPRATYGYSPAEEDQAALITALQADHDPGAVRHGEATTAQWARPHDQCLIPSRCSQRYDPQSWFRDGRPPLHPRGLGQRWNGIGLPHQRDRAVLPERHHLMEHNPALVTKERPAA